MPVISSNTLFHFTGTREILNKILASNFEPKYSLETVPFATSLKFAVPMVSFCDLPLSQIKNHLDTYGYYGIGMSKEWGIKNGVNPVLYTVPNSTLALDIGFAFTHKLLPAKIAKASRKYDQYLYILDVLRYLKPYKGSFTRGGTTKKNVLFYDEKEWRYVPHLNDLKLPLFLLEKDFLNEKKRQDANDKAHLSRLNFNINDIRYIIINHDGELLQTIKDIENIKGNKYTLEEVKILTSKILTCDNIQKDF
jgi:hypothetical protein